MGLISNATLVVLNRVVKLLEQILVEQKKQTAALDYLARVEAARQADLRRPGLGLSERRAS